MSNAQRASPFSSDYRALTAGLVINITLIAFEAMAVATILPVAASELGAETGYGWAFSAFMLANLVGTVAAGQRADRSGPAGPLLAALAFFAAGLAVAGLAVNWPMLIAGRVLQGFGGGGVMTLAYMSIRRGYPEEVRAQVMALVSSSWILPSVLGPALAGFVADHFHWRWVFLGLGPLLPLSAALMVPQLRKMEPRGVPAEASAIGSAMLLAAGAGLVLAGLQVIGWGTLPLLVVGVFLVARGGRRLFPEGMARAAHGLASALIFRGMIAFTYFGTEAFVPLGMGRVRGLSPTHAGLFLTSASLSWVVGSWTQARIEGVRGRASRRGRLVSGLSLISAGVGLLMLTAAVPTISVLIPLAGWSLSGLGMGLAYPTSSLTVFSRIPEGQEGRLSSSLNLAENVGIALGTGMAGAAFDASRQAGASDPLGVTIAFAVALLPSLLAFWVAPRIFAKDEKPA